ncbi:MAG: hypothetical protein IJM13_07635 [Lachnospiraceae bacterium]|nr:hypothetical protein [Lachnospiraceae bacterium]
MKKIICIFMAVLLIGSLAACGGAQSRGAEGNTETAAPAQDDASDFVWNRVGTFSDGNENYLMVTPSSDEETYPGWAVTFMRGEEMHGWIIPQEGSTLHGDLTAEGLEEDPFIVTISEEGENGLMMEIQGEERTYHFTPEEVQEASIAVNVNTEGLGVIATAAEGEALVFDEEFPMQSAYIGLTEPETYTFAAQANEEGWEFVKWTKDGADYSTDAQITVELVESAEYVAVFEYVE